MLTKNVINTVKAIDALSKQIASIDRERDEMIRSLKEAVKSEDSYCNLEYLEVISFSIVDEPVWRLESFRSRPL